MGCGRGTGGALIRERIARALVRTGLRIAAATPGYNSTGRAAALSEWLPTSSAVNALLSATQTQLVSQARDMERRNPWARNAADSFTANIVGTGITPLSLHPNRKIRALLHREWRRWTDESDADGLTDFYGQQALVSRTAFVAGECLARLRPRRASDGFRVPLQVQVLEPEYLPITKIEPAGNNVIRWGIEYDRLGRRVAYHLYREHPGEMAMFFSQGETVAVPAEAVCHVYHPRRPGQQRGETHFAAVMLALYELEKYDRAELVRKAVTAMFAFFERDIEGGLDRLTGNTETDENGRAVQGVEPGSYVRLPPGKTIEFADPKDVGGMYVEFLRVQLRKIAAGCGLTYEMLTGDLTGVNYSSIRAGLLEFRRRAEAFQHQVLVYRFCRPVWRAWCDAAALAGVIDPVDYATNQANYLDVEWKPPAWAWVDPLKDMQAEVLAIDNLLKARSAAIKSMGDEPEETDRMIAEDQAREEQLGLERRTTNGQAVASQNEQQPQQQPADGGGGNGAA